MPRSLVSLVALGTLLAVVSAMPTTASSAATPELQLVYTAGGALQVAPAGGAPFGAGATGQIPYGAYQVVVIDDAADGSDPVHMFQLSGPGVNVSTDLEGGDDKSELYTETLAANSTYTFGDTDSPSLAPVVFHTTGTLVSPATGSVATTTTAPGKGHSTNTAVVGSRLAIATFRGTLEASVGAAGRVTFTRHGKAITTLKEGRYTIAVVDRSSRVGFVLQGAHEAARRLSAGPSTGRTSRTIVFEPGRWFYSAGIGGRRSSFVVAK